MKLDCEHLHGWQNRFKYRMLHVHLFYSHTNKRGLHIQGCKSPEFFFILKHFVVFFPGSC